ncbi:hypothetical protein JHK86_050529 [Glycine max]|nr:hypothetical protein JHK86_050529 [Glycine max]
MSVTEHITGVDICATHLINRKLTYVQKNDIQASIKYISTTYQFIKTRVSELIKFKL